MRLTPLGKALIFLIGLGLVITAVYKFMPPDQQFWRKWTGGATGTASTDGPSNPGTATPGTQETPGSGGPDGLAHPTSGDRQTSGGTAEWITVPAGMFRSGENA